MCAMCMYVSKNCQHTITFIIHLISSCGRNQCWTFVVKGSGLQEVSSWFHLMICLLLLKQSSECFLAEDNQGIAWPVWRGGASLKSCPAIDHRTFLQCAFQMSLKSWPCHWPPALLLAQQLSSSMTTKGWPMGVTKATHLISWSDALIQDNLSKLEFLGSTVAPFLNLNDAHFGRLLSPERHFSSAYLGLQALLVTRRRGEWVVDGYSSPLTLLNHSLCFF